MAYCQAKGFSDLLQCGLCLLDIKVCIAPVVIVTFKHLLMAFIGKSMLCTHPNDQISIVSASTELRYVYFSVQVCVAVVIAPVAIVVWNHLLMTPNVGTLTPRPKAHYSWIRPSIVLRGLAATVCVAVHPAVGMISTALLLGEQHWICPSLQPSVYSFSFLPILQMSTA